MSLRDRLDGLDIGSLRVLDLGCGYNNNRIARVVLQLPFRYLASVDIHRPCLDALKNRQVKAEKHSIVQSEAFSYLAMPGLEFDVTLLLDVLEHFTSSDAIKLLAAIEAITCKRIIIFLPIGKCSQGIYDDNPYQMHKATWEVKDLIGLDFEVCFLPNFHKHLRVDAAWAVKNL